MESKTQKMVELSKEKTVAKINDVIYALEKLKTSNELISFYRVAKVAGVSRNFLYTNKDARILVETYREKLGDNSIDLKDLIIQEQRTQIEQLKNELTNAKKMKK